MQSETVPNHVASRFSLPGTHQQPRKVEYAKPGAAEPCCPHCRQPLNDTDNSIVGMFQGALWQFASSICVILLAALRTVRFALGAALCVVGLFGSCCRAVGLWLSDPRDKKLLSRI